VTRRERRFVIGAVALAVAAAPPALLAGRDGGTPKGCTAVTKPGFMGAQTEVTCHNRRTPAALVRRAS
jgi:hypothetical protein